MSRMPRILVVDDEQTSASCCAEILRGAGFDAMTAFSGEQAVEAANSYRPDLLLTDISMGKMSGIEAAAAVKQSLPDCKVLFLSGRIELLDITQNGRGPAFAFAALAKPVHPADLLAHIHQLMTCEA